MHSPTFPTLYDDALAAALGSFARRESDLTAMKPSLDLLDTYMPELRARKVAPHVTNIYWLEITGQLVLVPTLTNETPRLLATLLDLGFAEKGREAHGSMVYVSLQAGRLKLHVTLYPTRGAE